MSELLFNLPISRYPSLIQMEDLNQLYTKIYDIYQNHHDKVKEWSMISWGKLDVGVLKEEADIQEATVRKLKKAIPTIARYSPFQKLESTIVGFKTSLPLIE
jgi:hypothetical protein